MDLFEAAARRPALLEGLSQEQRAAVLASEGPVLILAGAGSGKTRVITSRIAWLVLERGVPSERILAVTFTNKAAGEMKARVEALLTGRRVDAWISTFHSLCVRILRREAGSAGLLPGFVIYDEDDQLSAVREAMRALDLSEKLHPPRRVLSRLSALKNRRGARSLAELGEESFAAGLFDKVAAQYQQLLDKAGALDFDDLLLRTVELLSANEAVREAYRRRFQYLLVDEYQDTNRPQYELVRLLGGGHGNVTVVGDEDQSIYSWRGAEIQNILDFEHDFPGARVLRLEENYRSSQAILDAATAVVANNVKRKGKLLRAVRAGGAPVELHRASDEYEEAAFVVARLAALSGRAAILYRMNSQSRLLEEALLRARIPYLVVGGVGFYERREVKDLVAYLRLVQNPREPVAFRRVLNVPPRGIGERTLQELQRIAALRGVSLYEALGAAVDEALLPARARQPLGRFRDALEALRAEAGKLGVKELIERTLAVTGYAAALAEDDSRESQERLENLAELLSAAADYESRDAEPSLSGFLDQVSLISDLDVARGEAPVVLMTLHSAKGLEFDAVFLVGLEEGLMPHSRALADDDSLEEERRLCYVGMTRAKGMLQLSWAQSRQLFGQRRLSEPSRFLAELPREALRVSGESPSGSPAWGRRSGARSGGGSLRQEPAFLDRVVVVPEADGLALRPGLRVRHPLFGVGTVLRTEGTGPDMKLTVAFAGVGAKRLVARYAGLEPA
ncbi:MAG: ATP-dependent helicase [Vicinamibacteria bacterium]